MLKKNKIYKRVFEALLIIFILNLIHSLAIGVTGEFQKIEPDKIPDELANLADVTKANFEKIKTLEGKSSFESMIIYRGAYAADLVKRHAGITIKEPNELVDKIEGVTEFKIDFKKNLFFERMNRPKSTEYVDLDKGIIYPSVEGTLERTGIIASEYQIESYPYRKNKDGVILSRIAHKRLSPNPEIITYDYDPRIAFNIGIPVWQLFSTLVQNFRNYENYDANLFYGVILEKEQSSEGVRYRMQLAKPGMKQYFEKFTLESKNNFYPSYIEVKNDEGITISEITTDFVEIQGIFVPVKRHVLQYDGNDGRLRRDSEVTFNYSQVNSILPENTFSVNNLGLKNDDKFIDKIEKKEYHYKEATKSLELIQKE